MFARPTPEGEVRRGREGSSGIAGDRVAKMPFAFQPGGDPGMRRTTMVVALAMSVLTVGLLASPALALKEKAVFGKFKATVSGSVKGSGEAGEMTIGPYKFEECEKELASTGAVTMGESETFFQEVKFRQCIAKRQLGGGLEEQVSANFTLGMEFHSNGSFKIGPSAVTFGASNSTCEVTIPAQWVPSSAETKGERTFEDSEYTTEKEKLEGGQAKKFGEFRERLDVEWEAKGITTTVKLTPLCTFSGTKLNSAGEAEFTNGKMEGELEEVTLAQGNLSFVPKV
jgi:hypothetical protein